MVWVFFLVGLLFFCPALSAQVQDSAPVYVELFDFLLYDYEFLAHVRVPPQLYPAANATILWQAINTDTNFVISEGAEFDVAKGGEFDIPIVVNQITGTIDFVFLFPPSNNSYSFQKSYRAMPAPLCLLPPLAAMAGVIVLREATFGKGFIIF
jgi:hypothetical protein